jgi:hypothetical protein
MCSESGYLDACSTIVYAMLANLTQLSSQIHRNHMHSLSIVLMWLW